MAEYQYGLRNVEDQRIMALPTDDQGILPLIDLDQVNSLLGGRYEKVRREVGTWEPVVD